MTIRPKLSLGSIFLGVALIAGTSQALAAGDATKGQQVFQTQCAACHSTSPGVALFGPSLADVYGQPAASVKGYAYSPALTNAHITWTADALDNSSPRRRPTSPAQKCPSPVLRIQRNARTLSPIWPNSPKPRNSRTLPSLGSSFGYSLR